MNKNLENVKNLNTQLGIDNKIKETISNKIVNKNFDSQVKKEKPPIEEVLEPEIENKLTKTEERIFELATKSYKSKEEEVRDQLKIIRRQFCEKASDGEFTQFIKLLMAYNVDPFKNEIYFIKYRNDLPGQIVLGKNYFLKTAQNLPEYNGFSAGIIVRDKETREISHREGCFYIPEDEELLGGWAQVHAKNVEHPVMSKVSLNEYAKRGKNGRETTWDAMPATMIRKVALVQALREAFQGSSGNFLPGNVYDESEIDAISMSQQQRQSIDIVDIEDMPEIDSDSVQ